jgi:hypothetical protein
MIHQEVRVLNADRERQGLEIQGQVVDYYINSYNMIATQAALLAGFAYSGYRYSQVCCMYPRFNLISPV